MKKELSGLKALVTGGTRGIGKEIAKRLLKEGADVFVTGTKKGNNGPGGCNYIKIDFSSDRDLRNFLKKIKNIGFDILINNAGINKISNFELIAEKDFEDIYKVNVFAPFLITKTVIPHMKKNKWGRVVNISSVFGKLGKEKRASYCASKFALDGMTTAMAAELAPYGIIANCVAPGFIETDLTKKILGIAGIKEIVKGVPMKRLGKPEEVAEFVCWLSSPRNTFISGQNISIDGGFSRV